jgi:hypothetical protein
MGIGTKENNMFMKNDCFRIMSKEDAEKFRVWARLNYKVNTEVDYSWHPVVRAECELMNAETLIGKGE